jgi:hypothetical protein
LQRLAVAVSSWALTGIVAAMPWILTYQSLRPIALDWRALAFAVAAATLSGVGVALAPIVRARRSDVQSVLKSTPVVGPTHTRLRHALVVAQLAITFVLLAGAGLLASGWVRLNHEHPGFSPRNLLTVGIDLPATRFPRKGQADAFLDELRRRAGLNPGVLAATISESIPPHLGFHVGAIETVDRGVVTGSDVIVSQAHVDDGFCLTLDIPLIQGRTFDERDRADGLRAAMISRATGRRLWPEASAVGRQFRLSPEDPWLTVVGVVGDVKKRRIRQAPGRARRLLPAFPGSSDLAVPIARRAELRHG